MATITPAKSQKTVLTKGLRRILLGLALSGFIAIGQPWIFGIWRAGASVGANDRHDIQGTWRVVLIEDCGRRMPVRGGIQSVTFSGDTVQFLDRGVAVPPGGSFVIDPVQKAIDLEDKDVRTGHGTYPGLYKLTAGRLSLCMGRPGQSRPSDFETSPRNMHTLLIMERM